MARYWYLEEYVWNHLLPKEYYGEAFLVAPWVELKDIVNKDDEYVREFREANWQDEDEYQTALHQATGSARIEIEEHRDFVVFGPPLEHVAKSLGMEDRFCAEDFAEASPYIQSSL